MVQFIAIFYHHDIDFASVVFWTKTLRRSPMLVDLHSSGDQYSLMTPKPSPARVRCCLEVSTGPDFTFIPAAPSPAFSTWFDRVYCLSCTRFLIPKQPIC
jgi:hypothetical protein